MHSLLKWKTVSAFLLLATGSFAQAPPVQWNKTYGGTRPEDFGTVIQTSDGGYLSAGNSASPVSGIKSQPNWDISFSTSDYWVVKSDAAGNVQWDKRFGGGNHELCSQLIQTSDGGYLLGGSSMSPAGGDKLSAQVAAHDYWILKLDAGGTKQWEKVFGGNDNDYLTSMVQTSDDGYILSGFSASGQGNSKSEASRGGNDYWIVRLNAAGTKTWDKTFGGPEHDYAYSVQQCSDGGFVIGGKSQSGIGGDKTQSNRGPAFSSDFWVVRTDGDGNKIWDRRFGSVDDDVLTSLRQTSDQGFVLAGYSNGAISFDRTVGSRGGFDFWIVKIDDAGTKTWDRRFGGALTDYLWAMQITLDGGYVFCGSSASNNGGDKSQATRGQEDFWIVKTNASGLKQWDKSLGSSNEDWGFSIQQTADGGYIVGGRSLSQIGGEKTENSFGQEDFWIVKLGPDIVLPVILSEFSGEQAKEKIRLNWITRSEINNDHFTVSRMDGETWVPVGTLPGAGNSTEILQYELYDPSPSQGMNFYRLEQTDYDGRQEIFAPVAVRFDEDGELGIIAYPNPARESVTISSSFPAGSFTFELIDPVGKRVYCKSGNAMDIFQESIPLSGYTKGIYSALLTSGNRIQSMKIEVQ